MSLYKILNILFAILTLAIAVGINLYVGRGYCVDVCSIHLMRGLINPVAVAAPILSFVFIVLLLFPADLFRRWLWYCGAPLAALFVYEISTISTTGGGIIAPTRVGMAELLAQVYVAAAVLFVAGYYAWYWYQERT